MVAGFVGSEIVCELDCNGMLRTGVEDPGGVGVDRQVERDDLGNIVVHDERERSVDVVNKRLADAGVDEPVAVGIDVWLAGVDEVPRGAQSLPERQAVKSRREGVTSADEVRPITCATSKYPELVGVVWRVGRVEDTCSSAPHRS